MRGDILSSGVVIQDLRQIALCFQVDIHFLDDMDRQTDGPGLIHDGAFDGLSDPLGGIGGKAETAIRIEFFNGPDQAQVALFNEIQQGQSTIEITAGNLDHQTQIAFDHDLAGFFIPTHGTFAVNLFLIRCQKLRFTQLVEVYPGRIEIGFVLFRFRGDFRQDWFASSRITFSIS